MNPTLKKQWIEALRSGKYRQGRGSLRSESGEYCCLGVLCDLVDPDGWEMNVTTIGVRTSSNVIRHQGCIGFPSGSILQSVFGIGPTDRKNTRESLSTLAGANDQGVDFNRIAIFIETDPAL